MNNVQQLIDKPNSSKLGPNLNFAAVEAYNLLRTNLLYSVPTKENAKIIGITSAMPSEGKSFTSINLAFSFAKNGSKVLLIDCDLRKPTIAKNLQLDINPGATEFLSGQMELGSVIHSNILHENMSVMTSGAYPPNPSELLGSEKMKNMIVELSKKFEYIFLDMPPVNSVADPLILSGLSDGIVLVVRHKVSRKKEVLHAVQQIKFVGSKVLGFVYNGQGSHEKYYKKYYKHNYNYQGAPKESSGSEKND